MVNDEIKQEYDLKERIEIMARRCAGSDAELDDFLAELANVLGPAARQLLHRLVEIRVQALRLAVDDPAIEPPLPHPGLEFRFPEVPQPAAQGFQQPGPQ